MDGTSRTLGLETSLARNHVAHCSFAYSDLAAMRTGEQLLLYLGFQLRWHILRPERSFL